MGNVKSCSHTKAKLYYLESIRSQCQLHHVVKQHALEWAIMLRILSQEDMT